MSRIKGLKPGMMIQFPYRNHRDVEETRRVIFQALEYGSNEYYPEPQWFLRGYCTERQAFRTFALNRIDPTAVENLGWADTKLI